MRNQIENIIWDWNGTLLDDRELCIRSINKLLKARSLPELTLERYLNVFGFPVKDYYQRIGFDFEHEPFDIPANQFIDHYSNEIEQCELHNGVKEILYKIKEKGSKQVVLSAMEQSKLEQSISRLNIDHFFETISGLDNDYAATKEANGIALINQLQLSSNKTVLIGDTTHDFEVAQKLNCACILIANGHQHKTKLEKTGATTLDSLLDLPAVIYGK